MSECKHGLRSGCVYCHAPARSTLRQTAPKTSRTTRGSRLAEQMNERMTNLKKRLRQIRGE